MRGVNNFIRQTAKDYDMEISDVRRIFDNYTSDTFYQRLELFIKERAEQDNGKKETS